MYLFFFAGTNLHTLKNMTKTKYGFNIWNHVKRAEEVIFHCLELLYEKVTISYRSASLATNSLELSGREPEHLTV